jgi:hypothetical protein
METTFCTTCGALRAGPGASAKPGMSRGRMNNEHKRSHMARTLVIGLLIAAVLGSYARMALGDSDDDGAEDGPF